MTRKDKPYRRLPGVTYKSFGKHTLWQGKDHLLAMYSNGMLEDYRRFYYRDIQGLVITKTRKAAVIATVIFLLCLISAILSWHFSRDLAPWSVFFGIVSGVFLVYLLSSLMKGPSCECRIITAVQNEPLRAVTLLRHGRKLATALKPLILASQNDMEPVEPEKAVKALNSRTRETGLPLTPAKDIEPGHVDIRPGVNRLLLSGLGVLLVLYAVMVGLALGQRTLVLVCLTFVVLFMAGLGSAGSLYVTPRGHKASRRAAWAGLAFVILAFTQSYGEMLILYFSDASLATGVNQAVMFSLYSRLRPLDHPPVLVADGLKAVFAVLVAMSCLILGFKERG